MVGRENAFKISGFKVCQNANELFAVVLNWLDGFKTVAGIRRHDQTQVVALNLTIRLAELIARHRLAVLLSRLAPHVVGLSRHRHQITFVTGVDEIGGA